MYKIMMAIAVIATAPIAQAAQTCVSREITPGDQGRMGQISLATNPLSVQWIGDSANLLDDNSLCGVELNATTICQTVEHVSSSTTQIRINCVDKNADLFNNKVGTANYVKSEVNNVGRFECYVPAIKGRDEVRQTVEFNRCQ